MAEVKIGKLVVGGYGTNCYILYREGSDDVIFIDPAQHGDMIYQKLQQKGLTVKGILLTHGHFDHIGGASALRQLSGAKIYALDEEQEVCESTHANVSEWAGCPCTIKTNAYLKDGDEITIADVTCKVIATPGHTKGSCCYYVEEAGILVCGDTIFEESVGRTDFPTGSSSTLVRSIKEKIFTLPDETVLYPGHGDSTTVEHEKKYNPFCQ
jgi:glyoxylase-like metal-dependent hydrolase (beta-lactamase superfamily II)